MKLILALLAAATFGVSPARADDSVFESAGRIGQFAGYEQTNITLKSRLLDPTIFLNQFFEFSRFFAEPYPQPGGLSTLLGAYSGTGTNADFRNGTPNGVNMLLWHLGFFALAQEISQVCDSNSPLIVTRVPQSVNYQLNAPTYAAVHAICDAGADQVAQEQALAAIWMAVNAYDLPEEEMTAFAAFFSHDAKYLAATPGAQITTALDGLFLNPHFLLAR